MTLLFSRPDFRKFSLLEIYQIAFFIAPLVNMNFTKIDHNPLLMTLLSTLNRFGCFWCFYC